MRSHSLVKVIPVKAARSDAGDYSSDESRLVYPLRSTSSSLLPRDQRELLSAADLRPAKGAEHVQGEGDTRMLIIAFTVPDFTMHKLL
jgi:hypothetical protein